jgi:large subunit ribosomal protein LX
MRFEISGKFKTPEGWQPFKKIVEAHNEKFAIEKVYSIIGSNHKVKRYSIRINQINRVES